MKTLENNDWLTLNNIIYKIYTTEDFDKMRGMLLEHMKMMIDFDSADFYLADPQKEDSLVNPVVYNCDENYSDQYEKLDYSKGILYGGRSMVYRETDIISDEKGWRQNIIEKCISLMDGIIPFGWCWEEGKNFWEWLHFTEPSGKRIFSIMIFSFWIC